MIFHLAIPAKDVAVSERYYVGIGATVGRKYATNVILDFFSMQLVLHQSADIDKSPQIYPRHFGIIVPADVFAQLQLLYKHKVFIKKSVRYQGKHGEHETFFLCDPSNNLIEFKCYKNEGDVFS